MGHAGETAIPSSRKAADILLYVLSFAALIWMLFMALSPHSVVRDSVATAISGGEPPLLNVWHQCDDLIAAAPPQGNLIADFRPLAAGDTRFMSLATALYMRSVYTLWPRRIYAAPSSVIITTSDQLAASAPPLDPQWLTAHHVRAAVTFGMAHDHAYILQQILINPDGKIP